VDSKFLSLLVDSNLTDSEADALTTKPPTGIYGLHIIKEICAESGRDFHKNLTVSASTSLPHVL